MSFATGVVQQNVAEVGFRLDKKGLSQMIYISLVGNQAMAVFNPLLALVEKYRKPIQVILLGTEQVVSRFQHWAREMHGNLPRIQFKFYVVSSSLMKDSAGNLPAHTQLKELEFDPNSQIYFNIAGGMNFQIAACVQEIYNNGWTFVFPEFDGVHLIEIKEDGSISNFRLPLPSPVQVEAIQGISILKITPDPKKQKLIRDALKAVGFDGLPGNCVEGGRFAGVDFDFVQNNGNTLCFFKFVLRSDELRQTINPIATDRVRTNEMYHRRIILLSPSDAVIDRARYNSLGKVETYEYALKNKKISLVYLGNRLLQALGIRKSNMSVPSKAPVSEHQRVINSTPHQKALVCFVGTDPLSTIKTIWSHKANVLWLLYTSGAKTDHIEHLKAGFEKQWEMLPGDKFVFRSVDFLGQKILDMPVPEAKEIEINITPGTKSHTFFLTLWALNHKLPIFSINNMNSKIESIPLEKTYDVRLPSPVTVMRLSGRDIKSFFGTKTDLMKQQKEINAVFRFLKEISDDPAKIDAFPKQSIEAKRSIFKKSEGLCGLIEIGDEKIEVFKRLKKEGDWLEQLVAYMLIRCEADAVNLGVTERLTKELESYLYTNVKVKVPVFRNEYDVLASFGGNICMVECKAQRSITKPAVADQAAGLASTLPRFVIPLACSFYYKGEPVKTENNVWVFGHRTLTDEKALKELIDKAFAERRTTNRS